MRGGRGGRHRARGVGGRGPLVDDAAAAAPLLRGCPDGRAQPRRLPRSRWRRLVPAAPRSESALQPPRNRRAAKGAGTTAARWIRFAHLYPYSSPCRGTAKALQTETSMEPPHAGRAGRARLRSGRRRRRNGRRQVRRQRPPRFLRGVADRPGGQVQRGRRDPPHLRWRRADRRREHGGAGVTRPCGGAGELLRGAVPACRRARTCSSSTAATSSGPRAGCRYAVIAYVASGHVAFLDADEREPVECIDVGTQAHAAWPTPDQRHLIVANQNGKAAADRDGLHA